MAGFTDDEKALFMKFLQRVLKNLDDDSFPT
jgi:hypothetical protein